MTGGMRGRRTQVTGMLYSRKHRDRSRLLVLDSQSMDMVKNPMNILQMGQMA